MSAPVLSQSRRAALAAVADFLVPRTERMPGAGDLGLFAPGGLADRVLAYRPDLAVALDSLLDTPLPPPAGMSPAALSILMQVVAGAYYLHPEVKRLIGYAGQEAQSLGRGGIGGEDLLARMMERPPRWRAVPAGSNAVAGRAP